MPKGFRLDRFFYITHIDNLKDILEKGILSHNKVEELGLKPMRVSNPEIVGVRKSKLTTDKKSLWDYANVYFRVENPMMLLLVSKFGAKNLIVLTVKKHILDIPGTFITDGNAACTTTRFYTSKSISYVLKNISGVLSAGGWNKTDGSKRMIMAECLVPDVIHPSFIETIYVVDHETAEKIKGNLKVLLDTLDLGIVPQPSLFFQPIKVYPITDKLVLFDGDMFFSGMQTLTISVNTMGIMGKGLASRAKYQFPDVYVRYQDLCKQGILKLGQPFLYKREGSLASDLSLEQENKTEEENETWFLLFPTKTHFKYNSDLEGIEQGLIWLKNNYKKLDIKSLAMPALGCGLGNLPWEKVGPILVKHLSQFDIPIRIYLPREKKIPEEFLTKEFLLNK